MIEKFYFIDLGTTKIWWPTTGVLRLSIFNAHGILYLSPSDPKALRDFDIAVSLTNEGSYLHMLFSLSYQFIDFRLT